MLVGRAHQRRRWTTCREPVRDGITLYISLTLHPTSLFIFFIGGFVAPRASYIVGGMLGVLSAIIFTIVVAIATDAGREQCADTLLIGHGRR